MINFILPISYLVSRAVVMACEKKSKSNETRIFANSRQGRYILFFNLELEQDLFYVKDLPSGDITFYLNYIIAMKNFVILLCHAYLGIHYRPHDKLYYFRKLVFVACISNRICNCPFVYAMSERKKALSVKL